MPHLNKNKMIRERGGLPMALNIPPHFISSEVKKLMGLDVESSDESSDDDESDDGDLLGSDEDVSDDELSGLYADPDDEDLVGGSSDDESMGSEPDTQY